MYLDRMKKARKLLAEIPAKKLRMSTWIEIDYLTNGRIPSVKTLKQESCGTVGCIAGWVSTCFVNPRPIDDETECRSNAQEYLGLSADEAASLFYLDVPEFLFKSDANCTTTRLKQFDKQNPAKRKEKILEILDYIINYGFTWLSDYEQSERIAQYGHN